MKNELDDAIDKMNLMIKDKEFLEIIYKTIQDMYIDSVYITVPNSLFRFDKEKEDVFKYLIYKYYGSEFIFEFLNKKYNCTIGKIFWNKINEIIDEFNNVKGNIFNGVEDRRIIKKIIDESLNITDTYDLYFKIINDPEFINYISNYSKKTEYCYYLIYPYIFRPDILRILKDLEKETNKTNENKNIFRYGVLHKLFSSLF